MAIINLTTKISESIDKNEYTAGIFIDLSKAFDTVDHSIIIAKLEHYGVRGIALEWFKNYLTERNQIVKFKTTLSDTISARSARSITPFVIERAERPEIATAARKYTQKQGE